MSRPDASVLDDSLNGAVQLTADAAPQSYADLRSRYAEEAACLTLLEALRWPTGFVCPECEHDAAWRMSAGELRCQGCRRRVSVTTGTVLHRTRTPLTDWFAAAWLMTQSPRGVAARELRARLRLGSYQTSWALLHRLRAAMAQDHDDLLSGRVHLDEVQLGRRTAGVPGRGVRGVQLTAIAVQSTDGITPERVRVQVLPESSPASLRTFLRAAVAPGTTVVTDGWAAYPPACRKLWVHERVTVHADRAYVPLPVVRRVDLMLNRWLVDTHLASVQREHLQSYLDEFAFRFNHGVLDREAHQLGTHPEATAEETRWLFLDLLRRAIGAPPLTYRQIVTGSRLPPGAAGEALRGVPA